MSAEHPVGDAVALRNGPSPGEPGAERAFNFVAVRHAHRPSVASIVALKTPRRAASECYADSSRPWRSEQYSMEDSAMEKLLLRIPEAAELTGVGRSKAYE